ncbi:MULTISPECIES: hypothetical protein [unclassified Bacillus cereus group]|uniref:hypothetical protein n=1 Tax=unclassified Bacillus cereus group TaxID=2750818 RepID=UPI001F56BE4A|nr:MULTISPECIES: hypothetical protein [unclassified Bacillus cereus group]
MGYIVGMLRKDVEEYDSLADVMNSEKIARLLDVIKQYGNSFVPNRIKTEFTSIDSSNPFEMQVEHLLQEAAFVKGFGTSEWIKIDESGKEVFRMYQKRDAIYFIADANYLMQPEKNDLECFFKMFKEIAIQLDFQIGVIGYNAFYLFTFFWRGQIPKLEHYILAHKGSSIGGRLETHFDYNYEEQCEKLSFKVNKIDSYYEVFLSDSITSPVSNKVEQEFVYEVLYGKSRSLIPYTLTGKLMSKHLERMVNR